MSRIQRSVILFLTSINLGICVDIYDEVSRIVFEPDAPSEYFGYSLLLDKNRVIVGAPKAVNRFKSNLTTGLVYNCPIKEELGTTAQVKCVPYNIKMDPKYSSNDMWFGATLAFMPDQTFLVCAPRWTVLYKDYYILANGICYLQKDSTQSPTILSPLTEMSRQIYILDGKRKEFGENGTILNLYAYSQAGISATVTRDHIILGAPGLLQWTGSLVDYKILPNSSGKLSKQPTTNPYFTKEINPDDYFGYSVDGAKFEPNGTLLFVAAAPRANMGYGQVHIFEPPTLEFAPMKIITTIRGPRFGSYFGASLLCTDVNGDGRIDLLVGAPTFAANVGELSYDQGAVFVYLNRKTTSGSFSLELSGQVTGSKKAGAKFGMVIADLGHLNDYGYTDVAVGAPFEDDGRGAVYIYRGSNNGLLENYTQRIAAAGARGFGIAISKGVDVDNNKCNDLAVGAFASNGVYLYRCVPRIKISVSIKVPDVLDLSRDTTNFTATFCIHASKNKLWPYAEIGMEANIKVDVKQRRAFLAGDDRYAVSVRTGEVMCKEEVVQVTPTADLSLPIPMDFSLELTKGNALPFNRLANIDEGSTLATSLQVQLTRDCGEDLICTPKLQLKLHTNYTIASPFVPGLDQELGVKMTVNNLGEPAYGQKVYMNVTLPPKRIPKGCSFEEIIVCDVPSPLSRGEEVTYDIEFEYIQNTTIPTEWMVSAAVYDKDDSNKLVTETIDTLTMKVEPVAHFFILGKALPNDTLAITRKKFDKGLNVTFIHFYEIFNTGPSDWNHMEAMIQLPENVTLWEKINGCTQMNDTLNCTWNNTTPAKTSYPLVLTLQYDLKRNGLFLDERGQLNLRSIVLIKMDNKNATTTTLLVLEPAQPIWPLVVGIIAGLLVLALIVFGFYKCGFFSRHQKERLKELQNQAPPDEANPDEPSSSSGVDSAVTMHSSTHELLADDDLIED